MLIVDDTFQDVAGYDSRVYQVTSGVRAGGAPEVQLLTSAGTGLGGYFRVLFAGSEYTNYLPFDAEASELEAQLENLSTMRQVTVSRADVDGLGAYEWAVTFDTNVGDVDALVVDAGLLTSTADDESLTVQDGDNAYADAFGALACEACAVGETPAEYGYADVDAATLEYEIADLVPGNTYTVRVSAQNGEHGWGTVDVVGDFVPPQQVPSTPVDVSLAVKPYLSAEGDGLGDPERLLVSFDEPESDGGADVSAYRVEWDTTDAFDTPGSEMIHCPTAHKPSVWTIATTTDNLALDGGYFSLTVTHDGVAETSDAIPWDAPATAAEETPAETVGDSKVYCQFAAGYCDAVRIEQSGSMQSKLEGLAAGAGGVSVRRSDSRGDGQYTWTVTFLEASADFDVALSAEALTGGAASTFGVTVTEQQQGEVYADCTGAQAFPEEGGLVQGQLYYVRVFAYNSEGFGAPQMAASPEKPQVVPGLPTGVTLEVVSSSALKVTFSPPADDGGATIEKYLVEWDSAAGFASADYGSSEVTMLSGGAPFFKTISGLDEGVYYYVRVSAYNEQGYGDAQSSSPNSLNPHSAPSAPTAVALGVTTDSMLTVSWEAPASDGGDPVSGYRIEWDTASTFDSLELTPNKGSVDVDDAELAYTLELLSGSYTYYVQVAALNSAGEGSYQAASPTSATPSLQLPGKPVNLVVEGGAASGEIDVTYERPRVPAHGYPCAGTPAAPSDCPDNDDGDPSSDGGAAIEDYLLEWSRSAVFSPAEVDAGSAIVTGNAETITGLTVGELYYVRVSARTDEGYGSNCERTGTLCLDSGFAANATAPV